MSLCDQFASDVNRIFINVDEMGDWLEFRISDGHGGFTVKTIKVVWDRDHAKENPMTTRFGVFYCDVMCFMAAADLPRAPVAGEIIYSPANQPWEVVECWYEEKMFSIALRAVTSQPVNSQFGRN